MSFISLDTEGERWLWGGVIGGFSIAFVATLLVIRRTCKKCKRSKELKEIAKSLYSEDENETVINVEGEENIAGDTSVNASSAPQSASLHEDQL